MNICYSLVGKIREFALTVRVWCPLEKAVLWITAACLERPQRYKVMQNPAKSNLAFWREEMSLQWEEHSTSNRKKTPLFGCQHWHPAELHWKTLNHLPAISMLQEHYSALHSTGWVQGFTALSSFRDEEWHLCLNTILKLSLQLRYNFLWLHRKFSTIKQ